MKYFLLPFLTVFLSTKTIEYIYPVASIDLENNKSGIYYVHQKSLSNIDLYLDKGNDNINKSLFWRFVPASLRVLPNQKAFSFIDAGRLRIKELVKRSPRSIDFDKPVFGIGSLFWINENWCCFSAKQDKNFEIFTSNCKDHTLHSLCSAKEKDCFLPSQFKNQLFYTERDQDRSCSIAITSMSMSDSKKAIILDCGYQQIIDLKMITATEGLYVEHMPYLDDNQKNITLVAHRFWLEVENGSWNQESIFKYHIPKQFLFGPERIHESVSPFLPTVKNTSIYFADIKQNNNDKYISSIIKLDLLKRKFNTITEGVADRVVFSPLIVKNNLCYGQIAMNPSGDINDKPRTVKLQ